jgi:molybdopterin molybdotransferase
MTILKPIAALGCGCDSRDTKGRLIAIDDALARIASRSAPVPQTEDIAPLHGLGRILAQDVCAADMSPPFDNAAMDGYALATRALPGDGPWTLPVVERITAGERPKGRVTGQIAARIFTGAQIPQGADAVMMQEDVDRTDANIRITSRPTPGLNIRRAGSEMAAGAVVLRAGQMLGPREIAACAAAGAAKVTVRRRLCVALLVTGNEVRTAGTDRQAAQIWDVNSPMLTAILTRPAIDVVAVEHGADDPAGLVRQMERLRSLADLVITTGGISVGEEDHIKPALATMGAKIAFSGVAIKPGKPVSFGTVRGVAWLGLPGNPLSAFITWQIMGEMLLRCLTGETGDGMSRRHVVIARDITRKPGRCELRPATPSGFDALGREVMRIDNETHSSRVVGLPAAAGLVFLPADTAFLPAGALVEFQPFGQMTGAGR